MVETSQANREGKAVSTANLKNLKLNKTRVVCRGEEKVKNNEAGNISRR